MANKLYEESNIQAIADAIREKNGSSDQYLVSAMADAIKAIESGGGLTNVVTAEITPATNITSTTKFPIDGLNTLFGSSLNDVGYVLILVRKAKIGGTASISEMTRYEPFSASKAVLYSSGASAASYSSLLYKNTSNYSFTTASSEALTLAKTNGIYDSVSFYGSSSKILVAGTTYIILAFKEN